MATLTKPTEYLVIFGPPASGKTLNSEALKKHFGCDHVFDEGFENAAIRIATGRVMILARSQKPKGPHGKRRLFRGASKISLSIARQALGDAWIEPHAANGGQN